MLLLFSVDKNVWLVRGNSSLKGWLFYYLVPLLLFLLVCRNCFAIRCLVKIKWGMPMLLGVHKKGIGRAHV